jgi:transcriptional regulator with XRE-family HTH domain
VQGLNRFDINQINEFIRCDENFPASPLKLPAMHSFIPSAIRRYRNQRRLTLENVSGIAGMSVQHLSEIESSKRDPRLSSIERIADAMELAVLLVPEHMAPDIRRYPLNVDGWDVSAMCSSRRTPIGTLVQPALPLLPESC